MLICWFVLKPAKYNCQDSFNVKILAYSKAETGVMAVSFYLMYPRFLHSEMMTHKDFSRSAASSRAIPVKKVLSQVWNQPAMPVYWGINIRGMQAKSELVGWKRNVAINVWVMSGKVACIFAWFLTKVNLHKQIANRILEPWQLMHVTLTTAKLANFFNLRIHGDAQPEIHYLAKLMQNKFISTTPKLLKEGQWHLPWVVPMDYEDAKKLSFSMSLPVETVLIRISAARSARSSYAVFDSSRSVESDLQTYDRLILSKPVHASPAEHQVTPDTKTYLKWNHPELAGNMIGWIQHRKQIPEHYYEG